MRNCLAIAVSIGLSACSGAVQPSKAPDPTDTATSRPDPTPNPVESGQPTDTADTADTAEPPDPVDPTLYCRSLDADWAGAYTDPTDATLADIIHRQGLLGDPTLYVDTDGTCRRRRLPTIEAPLAQLGRSLFFSVDLSGDRDTACATCHHPSLGGADALALPAGAGFEPTAVGEDRVRGLSDVHQLRGARNSLTIVNVALWDQRLLWDGRVEANDPGAGFNGESGGISTADGPSDAPNLVAAQSLLPIQDPHEMGGSRTDGPTSGPEQLEHILARLDASDRWQAAFDSVCGSDGLPPSWETACTEPDTPLITADHLADALSTYQRSLVFVDSPWSRYVQGDVTAISEAAKQGAIAFYRSPAEGGLNCSACHTGDFFTDEQLHAVGAPQIGPGDPLGTGTPLLDLGGAELTGDPDDRFTFRTPSLLNVAHTPPYFHAGSTTHLFWTVLHYRGVAESLSQAFGYAGEPLRRPPPWCETTLFANIEDCETLYSVDATHDGDLEGRLDGEVEDIGETLDVSSELITLFLESLSDARLGDPAALSPWIETGDALPTPTPSSDTWDSVCQQMVEWPQAQDLRLKAIRWLVKGDMPMGITASSGANRSTIFGVAYWDIFHQRFTYLSGLSRQRTSVAAGVLSLLSTDERRALLTAWTSTDWNGATTDWESRRTDVRRQLDAWRASGTSIDTRILEELIQDAHEAESQTTLPWARAFGTAWWTLTDAERTVRIDQLRRYLSGDLSDLPPEVIGSTALQLSPSLEDELATYGVTHDRRFGEFVLAYATWTAGPDCTWAFDPRQDVGSSAAVYFGYASWIDGFFFNLDTGSQEPRSAQEELAALIQDLETTAGSAQIDASLPAVTAARRGWQDARQDLVEAMQHLSETVAVLGDVETAVQGMEAAQARLATAETTLLSAELTYILHLRDALSTDQLADIASWIDCLESPETQAMRGAGGFDALGGGTCLP